jgi:hypothetical protein
MGYLGAGKRNGRKEEKKEEDLARWVYHKVLCLLFYSVFCNPVRINYNLPAGYGTSAVTCTLLELGKFSLFLNLFCLTFYI